MHKSLVNTNLAGLLLVIAFIVSFFSLFLIPVKLVDQYGECLEVFHIVHQYKCSDDLPFLTDTIIQKAE